MKAVLLAAGVGKRLWSVTQHRPKCLIELGGQALLLRCLESLASVGVRQAVLVVGYKQEMIRSAVGSGACGVDVRYVVNAAYQRGSLSSLWEARGEFDGDLLLMDADVLFHHEILKRLVASPHPTALCLDETVTQKGEECMAIVRGDRVAALSKRMPDRYDLAGEGVGFLRIRRRDLDALTESIKRPMERGDWHMDYEDALADFFGSVRVGYEKIGGLPWIEIDFPEDVTRAEREILPRIQ